MDEKIEKGIPALEKAIENLQNGLKDIRTGAANPNMLSKIQVEYYGVLTPLNQVSSINVIEGRQLYIKPFEPTLVKDIVKAIFSANIGLTPQNESNAIRINIPPLTEDKRKEYVKLANKYAEEGKIAIRNVRHDIVDDIKKDKTVPEDLRKANEEDMNKLTEKYTKKVEDILAAKTKEIMGK